MNRRVVIDPAHAALAPDNFLARAQAILDALPDDWGTVACVASFDAVDRCLGRCETQYMGPRWVFLRGGSVTTYCRTFEAMENIPDISRINPEIVRRSPEVVEQRHATHLPAAG